MQQQFLRYLFHLIILNKFLKFCLIQVVMCFQSILISLFKDKVINNFFIA